MIAQADPFISTSVVVFFLYFAGAIPQSALSVDLHLSLPNENPKDNSLIALSGSHHFNNASFPTPSFWPFRFIQFLLCLQICKSFHRNMPKNFLSFFWEPQKFFHHYLPLKVQGYRAVHTSQSSNPPFTRSGWRYLLQVLGKLPIRSATDCKDYPDIFKTVHVEWKYANFLSSLIVEQVIETIIFTPSGEFRS